MILRLEITGGHYPVDLRRLGPGSQLRVAPDGSYAVARGPSSLVSVPGIAAATSLDILGVLNRGELIEKARTFLDAEGLSRLEAVDWGFAADSPIDAARAVRRSWVTFPAGVTKPQALTDAAAIATHWKSERDAIKTKTRAELITYIGGKLWEIGWP